MTMDVAITSNSTVTHDWKRWIAECKMLQVEDDQIIRVLMQRGVEERSALEEVDAVTSNPYYQAGDWVAQRLKKLESLLDTLRSVSAISSRNGTVERRSN